VRSLDPDEKALWDRVAATIRPLSRDPISSSPAGGGEPPKVLEGARGRSQAPLRQSLTRPPPPHRGEGLSGATLDSSWDRRLHSGDVEPDCVLDLHGLNLDQAWTAIDHGLERAIGRGQRLMLLVTGHARPGDPPVRRGKIRAAVHDWLQASRHAPKIAAVRAAHRRHGGGGSLYIILRRARPKSTLS